MRSQPPATPNGEVPSPPDWLSNWLEVFVSSLTDYAVFALDLSGTVLTWHPGVARVLGYDREVFVNQPVALIFTDSDRHAKVPERELAVALGTGQAIGERWYVRADGSRLWGAGIVFALRDASGKTLGFAKLVRDLSAERPQDEVTGARAMQLEGDVARSVEQIRALASDLTLAELRERRRIAQLLHDDVQQQFFAIQMMVGGLVRRADALEDAGFKEELAEVAALLNTSVLSTRTLVSELTPAVPEDGEFAKALAWLAEHVHARHGLVVTLEGAAQCPEIPLALNILLFQCVQELLFNVVKHAHTDHAAVSLYPHPDGFRLNVSDDGRGFEVQPDDPAAPRQEGFGLRSVRRRLEPFGCAVEVVSTPGNGTLVTIEVPLT